MSHINRMVVAGQGAYYAVTGLWPLASYGTFAAVTGPKTDVWLVHTVGIVLAAVGIALLTGARRPEPSTETLVLGAGCACAFIAIETVYVLRDTISAIYLADTVVQFAMLAVYAVGFLLRRQRMESFG